MQCPATEFQFICTDIINIELSKKGQHPNAVEGSEKVLCVCVRSGSGVGRLVDQCVAVQSAGGLTRKKPTYRCGNAHGHGGWNTKKRNWSEVLSKPLNAIILHIFRI